MDYGNRVYYTSFKNDNDTTIHLLVKSSCKWVSKMVILVQKHDVSKRVIIHTTNWV